jgi:prepilin-type processing-associated H-X9-DG protein
VRVLYPNAHASAFLGKSSPGLLIVPRILRPNQAEPFNVFSDPLIVGRSDTKELEAGRRIVERRHNGRFSTLFCDGHIEALKTGALFTPQ